MIADEAVSLAATIWRQQQQHDSSSGDSNSDSDSDSPYATASLRPLRRPDTPMPGTDDTPIELEELLLCGEGEEAPDGW